MYACDFQYSTHCATGNYTSTISSRLDQHAAGAILAFLLVRDRTVVQRHLYEVFLCVIDCFGNCLRHIAGFSQTMTNCTVTIAYDNDSGKTEGTTTFGYFCNTVEVDQFFFQFGFSGLNPVGTSLCHYLCCCR